MKIIEVNIDANGETSIDLQNFSGKGCSKVLDALLAGEKPTKVVKKPDFFQKEQQKEVQRG